MVFWTKSDMNSFLSGWNRNKSKSVHSDFCEVEQMSQNVQKKCKWTEIRIWLMWQIQSVWPLGEQRKAVFLGLLDFPHLSNGHRENFRLLCVQWEA